MRLSTMNLHGVTQIVLTRFDGIFSKGVQVDIYSDADTTLSDTIYIYGNENAGVSIESADLNAGADELTKQVEKLERIQKEALELLRSINDLQKDSSGSITIGSGEQMEIHKLIADALEVN